MSTRRLVDAALVVALLVVGWVSVSAPTAPSARAATLPPAAQHDLNGDHVADVVAVSSSGALWLYPGAGGGALGRARQIGRAGAVSTTCMP